MIKKCSDVRASCPLLANTTVCSYFCQLESEHPYLTNKQACICSLYCVAMQALTAATDDAKEMYQYRWENNCTLCRCPKLLFLSS